MENIPPIFWMILIGGIGFFVCFVLYHLAMLLNESTKAVKDSRKIIKDAEELVSSANGIVSEIEGIVKTVKGTVIQINNSVLVPVKKIGILLGVLESFSKGLKSKKGE
jgi:hypothetical protein